MNAIAKITKAQAAREQAALWNGSAGRAWVAAQAALDQMFAPFDDLLADGIAGSRVLDVGCGTGGTTLALARHHAECVGIDPSGPMIAAARARLAREGVAARFIEADAQTYAFDAAGFDAAISRFGVMFFADPVAAFANLRHAARPGARLRFAAWRGAAENPFMTVAERAAGPLLPGLAVPRLYRPGPFAFADPGRIESLLRDSGWAGIVIRPVDVACRFAGTELTRYVSWMGPVGRALQQADEETRARVIAMVRPAFDRFVQGDDVCFTAACWMVDAHA